MLAIFFDFSLFFYYLDAFDRFLDILWWHFSSIFVVCFFALQFQQSFPNYFMLVTFWLSPCIDVSNLPSFPLSQ